MDNHQSAREALNHLLATDTFLLGTLVPTGDVELSKRWNAARPFLDDLDENRRRARSMKALFTRNARKLHEDNQRFYNYITKEGKERTDIFMGRLIDPLPHYGSPVLTGPSMPLTNTIQVQVGSIIQVGVGITFHGRTTDFRVGQVESLNPADGSASVRFNDGKLHPMSFIGGDMAKLNYFSIYESRDFEVPVSHIVGATLEEADNKYTHEYALKTLAEVLAQESARYMHRWPPINDNRRPEYRPAFEQDPFTGNPETYETEWAKVIQAGEDFYRPGGVLEKRIKQTRQKLDAALKAYHKELKG